MRWIDVIPDEYWQTLSREEKKTLVKVETDCFKPIGLELYKS